LVQVEEEEGSLVKLVVGLVVLGLTGFVAIEDEVVFSFVIIEGVAEI
jgi:hypothetical protein